MSVDIAKLRRQYGRLKGIKDLVATHSNVPGHVAYDYNSIVKEISENIKEDCQSFLLSGKILTTTLSSGTETVHRTYIEAKLFQFVSYLDYGFSLANNVIEIGSLYNSINDEELKSRCSDILSSPSNFDRVVNQASLVLEDRIRKKSKLNDLIGVNLVNKALNSDLTKSILKTSENPEEHEGISHICRGIVLSFRNPTHHKIIESYSREDALKFCAFVDSLLKIIDNSKSE
jgi:hypothetical protein